MSTKRSTRGPKVTKAIKTNKPRIKWSRKGTGSSTSGFEIELKNGKVKIGRKRSKAAMKHKENMARLRNERTQLRMRDNYIRAYGGAAARATTPTASAIGTSTATKNISQNSSATMSRGYYGNPDDVDEMQGATGDFIVR